MSHTCEWEDVQGVCGLTAVAKIEWGSISKNHYGKSGVWFCAPHYDWIAAGHRSAAQGGGFLSMKLCELNDW